MDIDKIINTYISALSNKIDTNEKFTLFRNSDPDFSKEILLKEAREIAYDNMRTKGEPNLQAYQLLDVLKYMKKSNEIRKLLTNNHAYITHIKEDGTFQYVYTNYGYDTLSNLGLI